MTIRSTFGSKTIRFASSTLLSKRLTLASQALQVSISLRPPPPAGYSEVAAPQSILAPEQEAPATTDGCRAIIVPTVSAMIGLRIISPGDVENSPQS
jgi:hypothetical protein